MSDDVPDEWAGRGWGPLTAFVAGLDGAGPRPRIDDAALEAGDEGEVLCLAYTDDTDADDDIDAQAIKNIAGTYAGLVRAGIDMPQAVECIVTTTADGRRGTFDYRIPRDLAEDMAAEAVTEAEMWERIEGLDVDLTVFDADGDGGEG